MRKRKNNVHRFNSTAPSQNAISLLREDHSFTHCHDHLQMYHSVLKLLRPFVCACVCVCVCVRVRVRLRVRMRMPVRVCARVCVCVCVSVPPFFDTSVGSQPNLSHIGPIRIDMGLIRT